MNATLNFIFNIMFNRRMKFKKERGYFSFYFKLFDPFVLRNMRLVHCHRKWPGIFTLVELHFTCFHSII